MEQKLCECGCGFGIAPIDSKGRSRRFVKGHNKSSLGHFKYPKIKCPTCGTSFQPHGPRVYCSSKCRLGRGSKGCVWLGKNGYLFFQLGKKKYLLHRLMVGAKQGEVVHHINGDKTDNRFENLEILSGGQSQHIRKHNPVLARWAKRLSSSDTSA